MAEIKKADSAGAEVLAAIGVDSKHVTDITVRMHPGDMVRISVDFIITAEQWEKIGHKESAGNG